MRPQNQADYAAFAQRGALETTFLAHGLNLKPFAFTLPCTSEFFVPPGLPGRIANAVFGVKAGTGWMFGYPDGGCEYPAYLTVLALLQALIRDGAPSLSPYTSRPTLLFKEGIPA